MTFKPYKIFYLLLICILLGSQQTSIIAEKIILENSIRDKVVSAISKLLGKNDFLVIVNIEYSTVGGVLSNTSLNNINENSENGYSPFPGLPTVPSRNGSSNPNENLTIENSSIGKIEVNIDIDEKLASFSIKEDIRTLVKKTIPALKKCEDCIKIGILQFLPSEKSNLEIQLQNLKDQVEKLQKNNKELEDEKRKAYLKKLENNYKEVKTILDNVQKRENMRLDEKRVRDSLLIQTAIEEEKNRHKKIIDEKEATEQKLERMIDSKIRADSIIISESMDMYKSIMKKKGGGDFDDDAFLGMQIGNSNGGGILIFSLFVLLIICFISFFYFMIKKNNSPIYLKKKNDPKDSSKNTIASNEGATTANTNTPPTQALEANENTIPGLHSLQQTATSLTVGEKESASNLINEWLEDNPNKNNDSSEE